MKTKSISKVSKTTMKTKSISKVSKSILFGNEDAVEHSKQDDFEDGKKTLAVYLTRLFIKNLPSSFTSSDLRQFLMDFAQQPPTKIGHVQLTDCKVLRKANGKSRCMGFVGFKSNDQAAIFLKLLDKSYCRTCRLSVSFATATTKAQAPTYKGGVESEDIDANHLIESRPENDAIQIKNENVDQRKRDFLSVMGVASTAVQSNKTPSRKFWSNDDSFSNHPTHTIDTKENVMETVKTQTNSNHNDKIYDYTEPALNYKPKEFFDSDLEFFKSKQVATENLRDDDYHEAFIADLEKKWSDADSSDCVEASGHPVQSSRSISNDVKENDGILLTTDEEPKNICADKCKANDDSATQGPPIQSNLQQKDISVLGFESSRLFVRNLPFSATEQDIEEFFKGFVGFQECHLPIDDQKQSKGFGYVTFSRSCEARAAQLALDGTDFHGRLIHILPARALVTNTAASPDMSSSYKKEKMSKKRHDETTTNREHAGWSASFVRGEAVVDTLAERLGLRKGDIMAVKDRLSSGDAAVRLALGETAVIEENRKYFEYHGYNMEALVSLSQDKESSGQDPHVASTKDRRSKTSILVKNLPADTTKDELMKIFSSGASGYPLQILLAPSRTIAVVEFGHGNEAKSAFRRLAYRRFKTVPLYLEWAPLASKVRSSDMLDEKMDQTLTNSDTVNVDVHAEDFADNVESPDVSSTVSLYIKNLSFDTSEESLLGFFKQHATGVQAVRIPKKLAPLKSGDKDDERKSQALPMGFGFVEFGSHESARKALTMLQGSVLHGHKLELQLSNRYNANEASKVIVPAENVQMPKLMVRNVPFQATRKDLLQLFGSFGQLKKVRLPKKFDGGHRGFAFVEYRNSKEAASAMKSLSRTHLYGRHLVLEWATPDEVNIHGAANNVVQNMRKTLRGQSDDKPNKKSRL